MRRGWLAVLGVLAAVGGVAGAAPLAKDTQATPEPDVVTTIRWCGEEQAGNRTLADQLKHRARALDEREHSYEAREAELVAAQARLDARIIELAALRASIDVRLETSDAAREQRVKGLVKMVESNRPATIAPMFSALEEDLAVDVLERMNRQKAGKLLGALAPTKAASLASKWTRPLAADLP